MSVHDNPSTRSSIHRSVCISSADGSSRNRIGHYAVTEEERKKIMDENAKRGTLILIQDRNAPLDAKKAISTQKSVASKCSRLSTFKEMKSALNKALRKRGV